jgi:hypothetical protein
LALFLLLALSAVLGGAESVLVEGGAGSAEDSAEMEMAVAGTGEAAAVGTRDEALDNGLEVTRLRGLTVR